MSRRRELGVLGSLDGGRETLDEFVIQTWAPTHSVMLAPKTRKHYASLYDHHIAPTLGPLQLRAIRPETISRWQADRLAADAGPTAVRHALDLLGSLLQRAVEAERIAANPVRLVRRARLPRRKETRPLAPAAVERMRAAAAQRDATLFSVLAYAGLRPGEALALQWDDIRDNTLLIERALSLGEDADTKTTAHRTVRLLAPLRSDLTEWRLACGRPPGNTLVFPNHRAAPWTEPAYQSWRRRSFDAARTAAQIDRATPYTLRHSFASLLLHEGRSVIYVARQLGHDARLTLTRYGHVIDELEDQPQVSAQQAIREARSLSVPRSASEPATASAPETKKPRKSGASTEVELGGLEPPTSWVRCRELRRKRPICGLALRHRSAGGRRCAARPRPLPRPRRGRPAGGRSARNSRSATPPPPRRRPRARQTRSPVPRWRCPPAVRCPVQAPRDLDGRGVRWRLRRGARPTGDRRTRGPPRRLRAPRPRCQPE
ncbi:tyrosine-type recombinase/integrase [Baekduia alba]|uniref:tyrosine-type recombinase/integrase n=1 Tax=Baekduia alba TaxID=2997333 RepID=UPI003D7ADBD6